MKKFTRILAVIIAAVMAMTAMCVCASATTYSWAGTWKTNWGDMTLTQNGSSVSGSYNWNGGKISGTVSGNVLSGTWTQTNGKGKFRFVMSSDGKAFTGTYGYNDAEPKSGSWDGTRDKASVIDNGDKKPSASLSNVKWDSSSNKLSFTIKFANVQKDAWVGIVPSGTADKEDTADNYDVAYKYLSSLKSGSSASLSASLKNGDYELRVYEGDSGNALKAGPIARAKFSVSKVSNATLSYIQAEIKKGSTLQLAGILSDSTTGKVTWSTSKSSVATVNSNGKVTAKSKGTATITAKYGDKSLTIKIKVTA